MPTFQRGDNVIASIDGTKHNAKYICKDWAGSDWVTLEDGREVRCKQGCLSHPDSEAVLNPEDETRGGGNKRKAQESGNSSINHNQGKSRGTFSNSNVKKARNQNSHFYYGDIPSNEQSDTAHLPHGDLVSEVQEIPLPRQMVEKESSEGAVSSSDQQVWEAAVSSSDQEGAREEREATPLAHLLQYAADIGDGDSSRVDIQQEDSEYPMSESAAGVPPLAHVLQYAAGTLSGSEGSGLGNGNENDSIGGSTRNGGFENVSDDDGSTVDIQQEYSEKFKIIESLSLDDVLGDDQIENHNGHKVKCDFDADSFIFATKCIKDFRLLNSLEGITFTATNENRNPRRVRLVISRNQREGFAPTYPNGRKPSTSPRVDQFPSFSAARFMFKNHVTAHFSVHIIQSRKVLGTRCPHLVTKAWNYAFNQVITQYRLTNTFNDAFWREEAGLWPVLAGRLYAFDLDGNLAKSQPANIRGKVSIFVMEMVFEILDKMASREWRVDGFQNPGLLYDHAKFIVDQSLFVVQSAGFKAAWPGMEATLGFPPLEGPPVLQHNIAQSFTNYNQWLQGRYKEVYKRAHVFFFHPEEDRGGDLPDFSSSALCAIDVAALFTCIDESYNVLPKGSAAARLVDYASKARRNMVQMPVNVQQEEDGDEEDVAEEDGDGDVYHGAAENEFFAGVEEDGTEYRDSSGLPQLHLHGRILDVDESFHPSEDVNDDDETNDNGLFLQSTELSSEKYSIRTRFPLGATTGKLWGNHQQNHKLRIRVSVGTPSSDNDPTPNRLTLHPFECQRACPIVQMYEPSTRAALQDKTKRKLRRMARQIPKKIMAYISELEDTIAAAHGGNQGARNKGPSVFELLEESFQVLDGWLERLQVHPMQTRYELTFASPVNKELAVPPMVPITDEHSPLLALSFAKRDRLHDMLFEHVQTQRYILIHGFSHLKEHHNLKNDVPPCVWAAYIAAAEAVVLMLGAGAGSKGSMLERSLQTAKQLWEMEPTFYYDDHLWVVHPQHIIPVEDECPFDTKVVYGVDPSMCLTELLPAPTVEEDEEHLLEENTLASELKILQGELSVHETEGLKGLSCPSQYRKSVHLFYLQFVRATNGGAHQEGDGFLFSRVDWDRVGASVEAVESVFKGCAQVILALYKVELAERVVNFWKKHPEDIRFPHDFSRKMDVDTAMRSVIYANTKTEITLCHEKYLNHTWPNAIIGGQEIKSAGKKVCHCRKFQNMEH